MGSEMCIRDRCLGRYTCALCFFFAASFTASFAAFREALSFAASFAAFRQLLCHTLCAQKQIDKNTWFYRDNANDNKNTRTNTEPVGARTDSAALAALCPSTFKEAQLVYLRVDDQDRGRIVWGAAQHSRRSGTAQIPRYLLPSASAPSVKLSLSVFGSTHEA